MASKKPKALDLFGFTPSAWVRTARVNEKEPVKKGVRRGFVFFFGARDNRNASKALKSYVPDWQLEEWLASESESLFSAGKVGPVWVFRPGPEKKPHTNASRLDRSPYARARDFAGSASVACRAYDLTELCVRLMDASIDEEAGALVGLELGRYSYQEASKLKPSRPLPRLVLQGAASSATARGQAAAVGEAVNVARHLTNVPASAMNPRTYAEEVERFFAGRNVDVEVWSGAKLRDERMHLLLAVGGAAAEGPRLVRLKYRPRGASGNAKPIAIVGKGITFDSGGLDIKPSAGMRWMKKDMGGSATVIGLFHWAEAVGFDAPLDGYLALAENAIGPGAFRPGDVIESRAGMHVEIHNTDAEGRLVLADALDLATSQTGDSAPAAVIDVATLTGAIKVALGSEIAGLFCNDDDLAETIQASSRESGDLAWRMPLFPAYRNLFKSTFADFANASDGFGGAITAALFLESFTHGIPWAHLDVYAWKDGAGGAQSESGGNGQGVQVLIESLRRLSGSGAAELG